MKFRVESFVYRCDEPGCDAAVCREWEDLPPAWQEITVGRLAPGSGTELDRTHFCPSHKKQIPEVGP